MATITRVLWLSVAATVAGAQSPESLAVTLRTKPSPQVKAALQQFARTHAKQESGALASLALAVHEIEAKTPDRAIPHLRGLDRRLPKLRDYVDLYLAQALYLDQQFAESWKVAGRVTSGPALARALAIYTQAAWELGKADEAVRWLRARSAEAEPPAGEWWLAQALERQGETAAAAELYKNIFISSVRSPEAAEAGLAINRLGLALTPAERLERGQRLLDAGDGAAAQVQFQAAIADLTGPAREVARVRLGAARFVAREYRLALTYLRDLTVTDPELDAERLYYAIAAARKARETAAMESLARQFFTRHQASQWRAQALATVAESWITTEDFAAALPYLKACAEGTGPDTTPLAFCRWRVAFAAYRAGEPGAFGAMRQFLERHPASPHTSAALYYLGRMAERQKNLTIAKGAYRRIDENFPGHFYAVLARARLRDRALTAVAAEPAFPEIPFPDAPAAAFEYDPATRLATDRARLLSIAGLDDMAERELRYHRKIGGPPQLVAFALAELAAKRGDHHRAVRLVKGLYPAYLNTPLPNAPPSFWRLAFPLPFREDLEKFARSQSLDPALVAGLIRQESEFNPKAVSRAKAHGLMQVMPATGRELSRKLGIRPFSTGRLLDPELSLQLGTFHFKRWLDALGGQVEVALAAYNAGKTRAERWLGWGGYRELAEFIEMIPFNETREYVQAVLRNADTYRRLYPNPATPLPSGDAANGSF